MMRRLGLGPVFYFEWLIGSRRWQLYAGRALFLLVVLVVLFFVWWMRLIDRPPQTLQEQANLGSTFFFAIICTQLALVLLAAPAATAGALCLDKARGTLAHLLVTDLSSAELILGKLAARLLPVLGLLLCTLPVLALNVLLGGVDPEALAGAFLITVGVAVLGCALALTLSVWGHKTHEVLLLNYLIWALFLLGCPAVTAIAAEFFGVRALPDFVWKSNPFALAFAPYDSPGSTNLLDAVDYFGVCLGLAAGLTGVAVLTVRRVTVRQLGQSSRRSRQLLGGLDLQRGLWSLFGPSLDANPVLWREWHRKRPSWWMVLIWLAYALLGGGFTLLAIVHQGAHPGGHNELAIFVNALVVALGLLLVSVTSSTSLAEERVRGSLEVLLTTPLPTSAIVWGKWWGTYRGVPLLAILPGLLAGALALIDGPAWESFVLVPMILAHGAALTSLGLALATWVQRLGRAIACSVTAYVLVSVAWPFAIVALFSHDDKFGPGLASASSFFGAAFLTVRMQQASSHDLEAVGPWCIAWTVVYLAAAGVLYAATLATFDRHLGRVAPGRRPFAPVAPARAATVRKHGGVSLPAPRRAADAAPPVPEAGD